MYFPGAGQYDLTGDGVADICLYSGDSAPSDLPDGVTAYKIGSEMILVGGEGEGGYASLSSDVRQGFTPDRDYLYPIPRNQRNLNHNLEQNPNWEDGLDF